MTFAGKRVTARSIDATAMCQLVDLLCLMWVFHRRTEREAAFDIPAPYFLPSSPEEPSQSSSLLPLHSNCVNDRHLIVPLAAVMTALFGKAIVLCTTLSSKRRSSGIRAAGSCSLLPELVVTLDPAPFLAAIFVYLSLFICIFEPPCLYI